MSRRIDVDAAKCMGSGNCVFWAPRTFELGDDDIARVSDPEGDEEDKIVAAEQRCPTRAISVSRDDDR